MRWRPATGDVDGDSDVVLGNATDYSYPFPSTYPNTLLLNDGNGALKRSKGLPADSDDTRAVALADVDADGDLDLVTGNYGLDRLFLNDGGGHFTSASGALPALSGATRGVAVGDVNGDGSVDLVFARYGGQNQLYLNLGRGTFTDASSGLPQENDSSRAVALADGDGDGDLDAVVANHNQPSKVYQNDGSGSFTGTPIVVLPASASVNAVALGDVDDDGDLDIALGRDANMSNRLFLNDGGGNFTDATARLPEDPAKTAAILLTDLDRDGDPDLVLGHEMTDGAVLLDLHRQLEAQLLPFVGHRYELRVFAEPGYAGGPRAAGIALSLNLLTPPLPVPPPLSGTLLGPPLTALPVLTIPQAAGNASLQFRIPPRPTLIGVSFYTQAVIAGGTNPGLTAFVGATVLR